MLQKLSDNNNKGRVPSLAVFALLVLFLTVAELLWKHISFTVTDSVGYHLFYVIYDTHRIEKGNYVIFTINPQKIEVNEVRKELEKFNTHKLIKQVACLPGDKLDVKKSKFYCNGKYLGKAKKRALDGERLTHFKFDGVIPKGYFFAYGKDKNSFDSRYFGLVPMKSIIAKAIPIM